MAEVSHGRGAHAVRGVTPQNIGSFRAHRALASDRNLSRMGWRWASFRIALPSKRHRSARVLLPIVSEKFAARRTQRINDVHFTRTRNDSQRLITQPVIAKPTFGQHAPQRVVFQNIMVRKGCNRVNPNEVVPRLPD